jgi:hypothetical protein
MEEATKPTNFDHCEDESTIGEMDWPLLGEPQTAYDRINHRILQMAKSPHPMISFTIIALSSIILLTGLLPLLGIDRMCTNQMHAWSKFFIPYVFFPLTIY